MGPVPYLAYIASLFGLRVLGYLSCAVMARCVCEVFWFLKVSEER